MRIGILGGSFNPVHVGHVRLAVEARELLRLDRVDFVPAAVPPHKSGSDLLPFGLRCRLLRMAVADMSGYAVNLLEARRQGPSYTWDTLSAYGREAPDAKLFFLMGASDLLTLPTWRHGLDLPLRADLVVVARQGMAGKHVQTLVQQYWPGAVGPHRRPAISDEMLQWHLPENGRLFVLAPPLLDISSTLIRAYWRQGRDLRFLTPRSVEQELMRKAEVVSRFWKDAVIHE